MKRTCAIALALGLVASPALAQSIYEDWQDNASVDLRDEISRGILIEKIEEGFYSNGPEYNTTIHGDVNNTTNVDEQHNNSSTAIGNLQNTDIRIEGNCESSTAPCRINADGKVQGEQGNDRSGQQAQAGSQREGQTTQTTTDGDNTTRRHLND